MSDSNSTFNLENYILSYLFTENAYIRSNIDYLKTFTWVQKDMFMLPFKQLEEISEIRKIKKDDFRKAYNVIKNSIDDENNQVNALANKIKGLLDSNPLPLSFNKNSNLSGVEKVMQVFPVVIIKSELYSGYSILYGKGRLGAAFVQNAFKSNVDIEDATAYLNVYYGRRK